MRNIFKELLALLLVFICILSMVGCSTVDNGGDSQQNNENVGDAGNREEGNQDEEDSKPTCNHSFKVTITKKATCGEKGIETYTCIMCGEVYNMDIEKTETHVYTSSVVKKATDTIQGERKYTCTICDHSYVKTYYLSKVTCCIKEFNRAFLTNGLNQRDGYLECTIESVNVNQGNWLVSVTVKLENFATNISHFIDQRLFGVALVIEGKTKTLLEETFKTPDIPAGETKYVEIELENPHHLIEGVEYQIYPYVV